ncbi:hypothetical protein V2J09_002901 [Rumex salicifolius]
MEGLEADDIKCWTWSKRYTFSSMIPEFDSLATCGDFFYLLENGELLLRWNSMITSYNLKTNKEKVVVRKKFKTKAFPYLESLNLQSTPMWLKDSKSSPPKVENDGENATPLCNIEPPKASTGKV